MSAPVIVRRGADAVLGDPLRKLTRWLLRDVVAVEVAAALRWTFRAVVLVLAVRYLLLPELGDWAAHQRDVVVTRVENDVKSAPAGWLDKITGTITGGTK